MSAFKCNITVVLRGRTMGTAAKWTNYWLGWLLDSNPYARTTESTRSQSMVDSIDGGALHMILKYFWSVALDVRHQGASNEVSMDAVSCICADLYLVDHFFHWIPILTQSMRFSTEFIRLWPIVLFKTLCRHACPTRWTQELKIFGGWSLAL